MKMKQVKMKPSIISKAILFFGCLFAVINLYGQEGSALSTSSEPAQSVEGPFILKRESKAEEPVRPVAQPVESVQSNQPVQSEQPVQPVQSAQPVSDVKTDEKQADSLCCGRHQLSVWGAGGLSSLLYSPSFGDHSFGLGGAFGLGYTFYFSKNFGILTGAELAFYNAKMKVDGLMDNYPVVDPTDGNDVDFRTRFYNYEEKQRMMNVNIPLALQFQTGGNHKFFASLGFKLGIPVSGKYKASDGSLVTSGYYEVWNQEFWEPVYLGYGTFYGDGQKKDIDFKLSYMGTAEAGVKWRLNRILSLYTGLYFEYGFNDIVKERDNRFLVYNSANPANPTINSTLTSEYTEKGRTESFTDRVSPMAVGLKLRLAMDLCKKVKPEEEKPKEEKKAPVILPTDDEAEALVLPAFRTLDDDEMEEDLRRAVAEYGSAVKGTITIELEGYEVDQRILTPRMQRILDSKIDEIRRLFGTNISIIAEGHTCDLGNDAYNMRLGQDRADIVRQFLISRGFDPQRITATTKGQRYPIVPNTNEVNRKTNRRVVLIVKD